MLQVSFWKLSLYHPRNLTSRQSGRSCHLSQRLLLPLKLFCFKFVVPITQIYIDKLVSYQTRISPLPLNASHDRHFMALMHKGCTPGIVACILSSFINFHEPIIRPKYRNDMEILPQRLFGFLIVLDLPPYLATDL